MDDDEISCQFFRFAFSFAAYESELLSVVLRWAVLVRSDMLRLKGVLFALAVISLSEAVLQPQSAAICPGVFSLSGLKKMLGQVGVTTFEGCAAFLSGSAGETKSSFGHAPFVTLLTAAQGVAMAADRVCTRQQGVASSGDGEEAVENDCATFGFVAETLNRTRGLLDIWFAKCAAGQAAPQNVSLEKVEGGLLRCFALLTNAFNGTKFVLRQSCTILRDAQLLSQPSNGSDGNTSSSLQRACSEGTALAIDRIVHSANVQTCLTVLVVYAQATFLKLQLVNSELRRSFTAGTERSSGDLTVSEQGAIVMCYELFHKSNNSHVTSAAADVDLRPSVPLCLFACHSFRNVAVTMRRFLSARDAPVFSLLAQAVSRTCRPVGTSTETCAGVSALRLFIQPSSLDIRPSFCLNLSCFYPLRATRHSNHWLSTTQQQIFSLHKAAAMLFPSAILPPNGSMLPCGLDCTSVTFTSSEENIFRILRGVLSIVAVASSCVAIVTFVIHRRVLRRAVRHLNVCMNVGYVIGPGSDAIVAPFSFAEERMSCFSDGTLQTGSTTLLCTLATAKYIFGVFLMSFFAVDITYEWYRMICEMRKKNTRPDRYFQEQERARMIVYVISSVIFSVIFMTVPLVRGTVQGSTLSGTCFLSYKELFYVITVPFFVFGATTGINIASGLYQLHKLYNGVRLQQLFLRVTERQKGFGKTKTIDAMESLLALLLLYNACVFGSFVMVAPIYTYLFVISTKVERDTERHIACLMGSCDAARCPPLPSLSFTLVLLPEIYVHLLGFIISLWIFNAKLPRRKTNQGLWSSRLSLFSWSSQAPQSSSSMSHIEDCGRAGRDRIGSREQVEKSKNRETGFHSFEEL